MWKRTHSPVEDTCRVVAMLMYCRQTSTAPSFIWYFFFPNRRPGAYYDEPFITKTQALCRTLGLDKHLWQSSLTVCTLLLPAYRGAKTGRRSGVLLVA